MARTTVATRKVSQALSQSVNIVKGWTYAWQIPVNISKTPVFHIGTLETAERSLNNYVLSSVSEVSDL